MPKKKPCDCVALQHEGGRRLARIMRDWTAEQRVEFLRQQTEELRAVQQRLRRSSAAGRSD